MSKKKMFDFCIGNPPYQEEQASIVLPLSQSDLGLG